MLQVLFMLKQVSAMGWYVICDYAFPDKCFYFGDSA